MNLKKLAEILEGGKADGKPDSEFDEKEIEKGVEEESSEHTKNKEIAKEVTKDHLVDDPKYYTNMEKEAIRRFFRGK